MMIFFSEKSFLLVVAPSKGIRFAKQQLQVLACPGLLAVKTAQLLLNSLFF